MLKYWAQRAAGGEQCHSNRGNYRKNLGEDKGEIIFHFLSYFLHLMIPTKMW